MSSASPMEEEVGNHAVEIASADLVFPKPNGNQTIHESLAGSRNLLSCDFGQGAWISDPIEDNPAINAASDLSNVTDSLGSINNAHTFIDTNNGIYAEFRVTGAEVLVNDTPEPSTALMLGGALLFGVVIKRGAKRI